MKVVIFDVDGVFTTGQFLYTRDGKIGKIFGPHDADGIKLLKGKIDVHAISADKRGFEITKKRIEEDMGIKLTLVSEGDRLKWIQENFDPEKVVYVGDGIHDSVIFDHVGYSIAPKNAFYITIRKANYVTKHNSGEGAVLDACLHILEKFLGGHNFG